MARPAGGTRTLARRGRSALWGFPPPPPPLLCAREPAGGARREGQVRGQAGPGRGGGAEEGPGRGGGPPLAPRAGACGAPGPASPRAPGAARGPGQLLGGTGAGGDPPPRRSQEWETGVCPRTASGPARRRPASRGLPGRARGWGGSPNPRASRSATRGPARRRRPAARGSPGVGGAGRASLTGRRGRRPVTKCRPAHPAAATCGHVRPGAGPEADSPPPPTDTDLGRVCV